MTLYIIENKDNTPRCARQTFLNFKDACKYFYELANKIPFPELSSTWWMKKKDTPFSKGERADFQKITELCHENGWLNQYGEWVG